MIEIKVIFEKCVVSRTIRLSHQFIKNGVILHKFITFLIRLGFIKNGEPNDIT